ncbi:response regulator transcription factor [Roseateles sp. BYS180W]|uniref:Response regulator transcription factor n=1 Tax=Roseateles rivi TaxID=3299028 RepID=A0ABW7FVQ3_9BURK
MKLLLIEDDPAMQLSLSRSLRRQGLQVHCCGDGAAALSMWQQLAPDIVLLDLSLPGMDGLDVLSAARRSGLRTPVIILTARGAIGDRILGLNCGADDYLPKPFDLDELKARIQALTRRLNQSSSQDPQPELGNKLEFCGLRVDAINGAVYLHDQVLDLPPREAALLRALLARPGHAIAKERLFEMVFPGEFDVQLEAIEVVAYRLRKRLGTGGAQLVTLRGLGYLLKAPT